MSLAAASETVARSRDLGRNEWNAGTRLAALDGLRFVAAASVLGYHYLSFHRADWARGQFALLGAVFKYGLFGVNLFFLISGFVICLSSWGRGLGDFVVSRVGRLFPAYWVAVLLTTTVLVLTARDHLRFPELLDNLTMMQQPLGSRSADGSYWTLWRELLFYLLFAVVVWRGVTYRRVVLFGVLWLLATVLASGYPDSFLGTFIDVEYSMYFVAGSVMFLMYRFRPTLLLWCLLGWCWILAENQLGRTEGNLEIGGNARHWWIATAIVTLSFLAVLAAALRVLNRLRWRWLSVVGALTYPLYLIHQQIGTVVLRALSGTVPRYLLLPAVVLGMLAASWLIHRFVERPLAPILKRRLRAGLREVAVEPARQARATAGQRQGAHRPTQRTGETGRSALQPVGDVPR